ncbi:family 1 glycosylhydrolase [Chryseosolibacter indicus]|uniref:dTDP-4-dehydrorhamnose reductase n=1 Tax=Chryseosolibacter indicus TaxID=2782351 RepID=A0ABS5VN53_9BACT|nr:family 1 glycosylhydrolase [Chryseosolibacter indicus]MBT1702879.1 sugar nucleotide-binding protein [Chryseosolibacter indicus]
MEQNEINKYNVPIWGGIECTVHRIGNSFGNQLERNRHKYRLSDLDLIADLGIKTIRYPVIWESIAPHGLDKADWSWIDERLHKLKELGITPIASFLHHGSGPVHTSLIDSNLPKEFSEFAIAVAERYPWLEYFTPVNEPLTTARFSCLYGHWYPHKRDNENFGKALLIQCKATVMAVNEIKKRIPSAKLVQTEDLGKCHGTPELQHQWNLENERRWLSLDMLTGRINENEFVKRFFKNIPSLTADIEYLSANFYPPDIIGINYYITSERYLDHEYEKYPEWSHGGNGIDKYADVDIVRADICKRAGHYTILKETHERYGLPIALTEVHIGATRDEQLRWFVEALRAANKLKSEGIDFRGLTVWSMFGAFDWNTLLTKQNNFYETGVFDVSSGKPRPTALAKFIKKVCNGEKADHQVLHADGWWMNPGTVNIMFGTKQEERQLTTVENVNPDLPAPTPKPVLITGATGTLGRAFERLCKIRNISYVLLSRKDMDIADRDSVEEVIKHYEPWAVINAAGFVKVDEAELNPSVCLRENTLGPAILAAISRKYGASFLTFSTDFVFNGNTHRPYLERDEAKPLNIYGVSKFLAETRVFNAHPSSLIIRTSSFFGPWDNYNFLSMMISNLEKGERFMALSDFIVSPTYVPDLVNACLDLLTDEENGIWHITQPSALSWRDFALMTAEIANLDTSLITTANPKELGYTAVRPQYSALKSARGLLMPELDSAINRFLTDRKMAIA